MFRYSIVVLAGVGLILGCEPEDGHLFFPEADYPVEGLSPPENLQLQFVKEYGDRDHGLVFGRISGIAVSPNGTLAVFDQVDCRIWFFDTHTGESNVAGGCGDGPGEFRSVTTGTFSGETLWAFDSKRVSILRLSKEGVEIGRSIPPIMELGAMAISDLDIAVDGSILTGLDLMPNTFGIGEHHQIASLSESGTVVSRRGLLAPPIAQRTPRATVRDGSLCAAGSTGVGEFIVAVNTWGPQIVVLRRADFLPLFSLRVPARWATAVEDVDRLGNWAPMGPIPQAACGGTHAVVGYRMQGRNASGDVEILSALMVVLEYSDGTMTVLGGDLPPADDSVLKMTPGDAVGNRFFFYSNSFFGHPIVREYRLKATAP